MRGLFFILIALVGGILAGWLLQLGADEVALVYGEWTLRARLSVMILLLFVIFVSGYLLARLALRLLRLPVTLRRWREYRRGRNSEKLLARGLLALLEDNWPAAERAFRKGAAYSRTPLVNYLAAALAAERQGAQPRSEACLELARQHDQADSPAVALAQARLQIKQQQPAQAHQTVRALARQQPANESLKLMLLETATAAQDWEQVAGLLQECERRKLLPAGQMLAKQRSLYTERLRQAGSDSDCTGLDAVWRAMPRKYKKDVELLRVYITERLRAPDGGHCEALLRHALKQHWDSGLARLYGLVSGKDPKRQLDFAEKCLPRHPGDPALLLTLGRLCKQNQLWGKARRFLEQSIAAEAGPEASRELADLLEQQGDQAAAARYYQLALSQTP